MDSNDVYRVTLFLLCRGQLKEGLALFEKAIALAQTEAELAHLLSLRDAADAQGKVAQRLGIPMGLS